MFHTNQHLIINRMKKCILFIAIVVLMASCNQAKQIAYFKEPDTKGTTLGKASFDARIKPKDMLSISVVSSEPEASRRYNLFAPQQAGETVTSLYSQPTLQNYLVGNDGVINFPSLGIISVKGISTKELEELLSKKLKPYFSQEMPVITIRIVNFSINVLGEVNRPGKYETTNEQITLLQALALASDMTIYGRRDNVKVIRVDSEGVRRVFKVNLNDNSLFNSPAYFLEQNDVIYVEPNKSKSKSSKYGTAESYLISTVSVGISLVTMLATIISITRQNR